MRTETANLGDETMTATKSATWTGTLTKCEQRLEDAVDWNYSHRYSPNTEHYNVVLDCVIELEDGRAAYFVVRSAMNVTSGGPCAVITFRESEYDDDTGQYIFPVDHPWFRKVGDVAVSTREQAADTRLEAKVRIGDTIMIKGRVKAERVSKAGKAYLVLTHVKREK